MEIRRQLNRIAGVWEAGLLVMASQLGRCSCGIIGMFVVSLSKAGPGAPASAAHCAGERGLRQRPRGLPGVAPPPSAGFSHGVQCQYHLDGFSPSPCPSRKATALLPPCRMLGPPQFGESDGVTMEPPNPPVSSRHQTSFFSGELAVTHRFGSVVSVGAVPESQR